MAIQWDRTTTPPRCSRSCSELFTCSCAGRPGAGTPLQRSRAPGCSRPRRYSIFRGVPVLLSCRCSGSKHGAPYVGERGARSRKSFRRKELLLKLYATFGLPALLLAVALVLASCGGTGGSAQNAGQGAGNGDGSSRGMAG